ncbi:hypothetical protein [Sphingobium sp. WCS2017Hpa-17]|uniref:hypothetical protein n=1 Tax=Sphingobium sp. WCS2017Hpa-17 TaxID=3073638 RepID=UPI0028890894|nr:hypothetical protein [Sphingobium sp. WCS2017Hpa-17]
MNIASTPDIAVAKILGSLADEFTRRAVAAQPRFDPETLAFEIRERKNNPALRHLREEAWNMLLELYLARRCPTVSSLCIASHGPSTTALRHISTLCRSGLAERVSHIRDRRKVLVSISNKGREIMDRHFERLGR